MGLKTLCFQAFIAEDPYKSLTSLEAGTLESGLSPAHFFAMKQLTHPAKVLDLP